MNLSSLSGHHRVMWRLRAGQQLRLVAGEDESVVFNDQSGDTHLLSALAVSLLQRLQQLQQAGPASSAALSVSMADTWEFDSAADAEQTTDDLLAELGALGLVDVSEVSSS